MVLAAGALEHARYRPGTATGGSTPGQATPLEHGSESRGGSARFQEAAAARLG